MYGFKGGVDVGFVGIVWVTICDTTGWVVEIIEEVGLNDVGWTDWEEEVDGTIVRSESSTYCWM